MQKRNTVLILGIFAIIVMITAQIIILRGLWKQQNEALHGVMMQSRQLTDRVEQNAQLWENYC